MAEDVAAGLLDVALLAAPGPLAEDATTLPIVTEGLVALVPAEHPLAKRPTATAAEARRRFGLQSDSGSERGSDRGGGRG